MRSLIMRQIINFQNFQNTEFINKTSQILKFYVIPYLVFFLVISFLFKDNISLGMQFDEVFRINNLIPLFYPAAEPYNQSIFSISFFGFTVPLMYKAYVSTAILIPYLPLLFFKNDLLFGLRFLYGFYFFLSISVFFFIMSKKFDYTISFLTSLLVITSPLFYPEALFGFAHCFHLIFLSLSIYFFYVFFKEKSENIYLFSGTFLLFFCANIEQYFLWVIAAIIISSILVFPHYWKIVLSSSKYFVIMVLACMLGGINFFIYNITFPFATIEPMYLKLFDPLTYNQQPVNFVQTPPLSEDIINKISIVFPSFFEGYGIVYQLIILILVALYIFMIFKIIKTHDFSKYGHYFFPFFCFCIIFLLILISPNTTRAGHYVFLILFFELSIVSFFYVSAKIFNKPYIFKLLIITLICLVALNFIVSEDEIHLIKESKGTNHYSPAIFEVNDFINNESLPYQNIIFLEWGMDPQLYFLNQGKIKVNSLVFELYDTKSYTERESVFKKIFMKRENFNGPYKLYFPLYTEGYITRDDAILSDLYYCDAYIKRDDTILSDFNRFVIQNHGTLKKVKTFYESDGSEVIILYELDNATQFQKTIKNNGYPPFGK